MSRGPMASARSRTVGERGAMLLLLLPPVSCRAAAAAAAARPPPAACWRVVLLLLLVEAGPPAAGCCSGAFSCCGGGVLITALFSLSALQGSCQRRSKSAQVPARPGCCWKDDCVTLPSAPCAATRRLMHAFLRWRRASCVVRRRGACCC